MSLNLSVPPSLFLKVNNQHAGVKRHFTNWSDIDICSASFLHNADDERSVQRGTPLQNVHTHTHKQTVDAGTQKAEGKWGGKKTTKKNRTCLQGRLKIKRNTIPACIWVEASPPLPPLGRVTRSKCSEDLQSMPNRGRIPLLLLPSDRVLGLLLRPKPSIQLP